MVKLSEETRARKSADMRRLWADPAYRAMMRAAKTARWTRERRYAWSLHQQARLASSGTRARMSGSAKAKWARRRSTVVGTVVQDAPGVPGVSDIGAVPSDVPEPVARLIVTIPARRHG